MTPEETGIIAYFLEHWGKFSVGASVIIGFIYQTGAEHQKYTELRCRVSAIENNCDERLNLISTMNSNLCRIMGKINIQPVEEPGMHRRREDK